MSFVSCIVSYIVVLTIHATTGWYEDSDSWSPCNAPCGGGTRSRHSEVHNVTEELQCNRHSCNDGMSVESVHLIILIVITRYI